MAIFNNTGGTITVTSWTTNAPITYTWTGTAVSVDVEQDIEREDEQMAATVKQYEMHPVSPVLGALMRKNEENTTRLFKFDKWTDDETFLVLDVEDEQKADEWECLTPAFHGYAYERASGVGNSGYPGLLVAVVGWQGVHAVIRQVGRSATNTWMANEVAALAPLVNPDTETAEQTIARLTRAKARLEEGLRARMVAEGVARNWCGEFDPILDSSGLGPRKAKGWVHGSLEYRVEVSGDLTDPALIEKIKANPGKYIAWDRVKVTEIEAEPAVNSPMLSI